MALPTFTSTTLSGFLESDWDLLKAQLTTGGYDIQTLDIRSDGGILALSETTTPTPLASYGKVYTKSDNELYFQDGAGTESQISNQSGGSSDIYTERTIANEVITTTLLPYRVPVAGTISETRATLSGLPAGQSFKIDIRKNGTASTDSVHSSDTPIEITTGQSASNGVYTSTGTLDGAEDDVSAGDVLWYVVTQVGSTVSGTDLVATVKITPS